MTNTSNNNQHFYTKIDYKKRICLAMDFISRNIERELSLEEIAASASFSMFHFHRIFKTVVGETVAEFTRRLRLELAANRLIGMQCSDITTIAIECGFSSSQNFARAFRRHFGMTPTQYRNSKIGNKLSKNENSLSLVHSYTSDSLINNLFNKERNTIMKAEVKEMPGYKVAYFRKIGAYGPEVCQQGFAELMQWAGPRKLVGPKKIIGIYWDNPEVTPAEKCRFDACVIVPEDANIDKNVNTQEIWGGPYAVCHFELKPEDIQKAWDDAFGWFCNSGYECADKPCYELYYNDATEHPEGKWIFDICIPLKQNS